MSELPNFRTTDPEDASTSSMVVEKIQDIQTYRGREGVDYRTLKLEMDAINIDTRALRGALWGLFSEGRLTSLTNFDCITLVDPQSTQEQFH